MDGVCYKRGLELYLYYFRVGTELSVSCTQVRRLCLTSTPRESTKGRQVGPAGPPRAASLGLPPISHRLLVDAPDSLLKSEVVAWLQRKQLEACRPQLGQSAWLWLFSGLHCSVTLITSCTLFLKLVWVLTLWFVTANGPNLTWFKRFGLDL